MSRAHLPTGGAARDLGRPTPATGRGTGRPPRPLAGIAIALGRERTAHPPDGRCAPGGLPSPSGPPAGIPTGPRPEGGDELLPSSS